MQWFLLNEICTDTHLLDCCGTDSSRKFCGNLDGKKYRIGNVYLCTEKHGLCLSVYVEWYENGWKEADHGSHVAEIDETCWCFKNQHHLLTTCTWDALNVNANRTRSLSTNTDNCSNHEFLPQRLNKYQRGRNGRVVLRHGRTCEKVR